MDSPDRRQFLTAISGLAAVGGALAAAGRVPPAPTAQDARESTWPARVPALNQQIAGKPLAYLDNAATTLRPRQVIDALRRYDETDNANPSASLHTLARRSASALDAARSRVGRFINAFAGDVIFTRGTTEGVNLVASTWGEAHIRGGDEIVLSLAEHNSNLFPWQRLAAAAGATIRIAPVESDGRLTTAAVDAVMSSRTRLVAITHVSNVLGIVNPVAEIASIARRRGAATFVDAAQSAPHVRLDVGAIDCDFLAFSSHKMLGPMGVGVLWAREERLKEMPPYHVGSNMGHGADLKSATFEEGALRFQAGTPNVSGPVGLAAAIDLLDEVGFEAMAAHDRELSTRLLSRLGAIRGVRIIGATQPPMRVPVVSFTIDGIPVGDVVAAADAAGIAIRGGDLAALPLLQRFGVSSAARVSAYVYNTVGEIDRLADVLSTMRPR